MADEKPVTVATRTIPARRGGIREWQRWAPYAAVVWSLVYAVVGGYWAVSGRGFPYPPELASDVAGSVAGRFGPAVAWILVITAGLPAAAAGTAMLRGARVLRPFLIAAGGVIAGGLLLMTDIDLLITLAYLPFIVFRLLTGTEIGSYVQALSQWALIHQWLCLIGGFFWLAATVTYARRSVDACLHCGRRDRPVEWNSPGNAARWGRVAVYVAMVAPVLYALTRYAWALGIPLGLSEEVLRRGQASGEWISGLFLATFGLVGAALMLGLVQRWGEVFPRWMIGLAGKRVPVALAVIPASIVSALLMVAGISIWSGYDQMADAAVGSGQDIVVVVGPTLLFPVWGAALGVAALGYYYRRRGPCSACGRSATREGRQPPISP
jgi:hypothetical protein